MYVGTVYRKNFHYSKWESVKCCVKSLGRIDLVHMLALQKLKFYHRLKRSCNSNDTVRKIFLFMQLNNECAQLFATYSCRKSDSVCKLCMRVEDHFARICAPREAVM